jgi:subtilisin family serine protease
MRTILNDGSVVKHEHRATRLRFPAFFRRTAILLFLLSGCIPAFSASDATSDLSLVDIYVVLDGLPVAASLPVAKTGIALSEATVQMKRRGLELMARHAALQSRLEARGAIVQSHLTRLGNAIRIRVPSDKLAAVEAMPGVKKIFKARHHRRALTQSVPYVGAPAVWSSLASGVDGRGVRVGIVDTGIDYTHADFGGSGVVEDYRKNDSTRIEPGSFPTAKVVGGFDFAGDEYDAGDPAHSIPHPDPDPLDGDGHGTHVAGILAGFGVAANGQTFTGGYSTHLDFQQFSIGPGVAPRALLYALKIFGTNVNGSTGLVVDALEWASDPNGDYDFSDRLDVVNLSLGSTFGTDDPEDPELVAINNLATLGCVVVCAAGNDGNVFYASGPPGSASWAIAVANSIDKAERAAIQIVSPSPIAGQYQALEGDFTAKLADTGPVETQVVYAEPGDACGALENADALLDKIALIDRGICLFVDKIQAAQDAGAIGVIMVNNQDGDPIVMGGDNPDIYIPGVMITKTDGDLLKAHLQEKPIVRLDAGVKITLTNRLDNLEESSSRGPVGLANYLKPEIAAPGTSMLSASMGTGTNGVSYSGTSMASPMVAGAAALLRQAHPSWPVEAIKAALMNSASATHDRDGRLYPESMTGAGRLQVDKAIQMQVTAAASEAAGNVALCYGSLALLSDFQTNRTVVLTNHGSSAIAFQVAVSNTVPQAGVRLTPDADAVSVPAFGTAKVIFTLSANPAQLALARDSATPSTVGGLSRQSLYEFSGQIWFLHDDQSIHVPFYANLRGATDLNASTNNVVLAPELNAKKVPELSIPITGASLSTNAVVSAFELGATFPNRNLLSIYSSDAHLLAVGAASDIAISGSISNAHVYIGLATATSWPTPQPSYVNFEVDIDTNRDGYADFILSNDNASPTNTDLAASDVFLTLVNTYDSNGNLVSAEPDGFLNCFPADILDTAPFNNSVLVLTASAAKIGLTARHSNFRYRVYTSGIFQYISETGWIDFDAQNPIIDAAFSGLEGTPMHADGQPIAARLNREAAANGRQRLPGLLLLHHHNLEGNRIDVIRFDLSHDDLDSDGLPDWWEFQYYNSLEIADATTDSDGDGFSDLVSYQAGVDPTSNMPRIKLLSVPGPDNESVQLSWTSRKGKTYTVLRSEVLAPDAWSIVATNLIATPPANTYTDTDTANNTTRYYRIRVQ